MCLSSIHKRVIRKCLKRSLTVMRLPNRTWCSYSTHSTTARGIPVKNVRRRFLEYFIDENHHSYLRSAPVASLFDSSLDLIHSGGHQFTRVFTGDEYLDRCRVANVQKCIKIRKSINDLGTLHLDPCSVLFFEMLGNWSFNGCDKEESCRLAWNLLTSPPFAIERDKLFVSYFNGDETLNLPADEEVRNIWLEIGVPASQILPANRASNFWELLANGPCGTCTKIFYASPCSSSMLELWNIAFMKYNCINGVLKPLPCESVNAGLGLERLASVLQRTYSCYHIDSFESLFATIEKISGAPEYRRTFVSDYDLNTKYRQLADFCRTITVAVSDNVFPDTNSKIKRILRKALHVARTDFKQQHPHIMLMELSARVVETLQEAYPEIGQSLKKVQLVIENEENIIRDAIAEKQAWLNSVKHRYPFLESPSFLEYPETMIASCHIAKMIEERTSDSLSVCEILRVRDKYGITQEATAEILKYYGCTINWDDVNALENETSDRPREEGMQPVSIEQRLRDVGIFSDDSLKHDYFRNENHVENAYTFPEVEVRLLAIVDNQEILSVDAKCDCLPDSLKKISRAGVIIGNREFGFVFDRTNFATDVYGQFHDIGYIIFENKYPFKVNRAEKLKNLVIHYAELLSDDKNVELKASFTAKLSIDSDRRLKLMKNNTLYQLVLRALAESFPVVYLKGLRSDHEFCQLETSVMGKEVNVDECGKLLELKVRDYICKNLPVTTKYIETSLELLQQPNVLFHPNMIYPYKNIKVVTILDENEHEIRQDPSDRVHVCNTGDIGEITIPCLKYVKGKRLDVCVITGDEIQRAFNLQNWVQTQMTTLKDDAQIITNGSASWDQVMNFGEKLYTLIYKMEKDLFFTPHLITRSTYSESQRIKTMTSHFASKLSTIPSEISVEFLRDKIEKLAADDKFAVYFCVLPITFLENLSFIVDVLYTTNFPTLFLCYTRGKVRGVCHVPEPCKSDLFNAEIWTKSVVQGLPVELAIKEEADNTVYCYLKGNFVKYYKVANYVEQLTVVGRMVAEERFVQNLSNPRKSAFQDAVS